MFKINDNVKINNTNLIGKITRIKKTNKSTLYTVSISGNNSNIIVEEEKLSHYNVSNTTNKNSKRSVTITSSTYNSNYTNEIMLRHQTVEEALENLERFISESICNKEKRIRIIHGRHGGILRNAVHEYLKNSPYIDKFELGNYYEGSIGVTIAYLK